MSENLLTNLGEAIKAGLVTSLKNANRVATGRTIKEIEVVAEGSTRMYIIGPARIMALEQGRKATGANGPVDRQQYGPFTFKQSLYLWMQARNIDKKAFYPIYKKINAEGYKGTPGVITEPLSDKVINKAMDDTLGPLALLYTKQIFDLLK